ncbi:hypothetical protein SLA2020_220420 [Shorea laevis]
MLQEMMTCSFPPMERIPLNDTSTFPTATRLSHAGASKTSLTHSPAAFIRHSAALRDSSSAAPTTDPPVNYGLTELQDHPTRPKI